MHSTTPLASLTVLTHGAFRVQEEDNPEPTLAALSGAVNVFAQELHPTEVRLIDIDAQSSDENLNLLTQRLAPKQETVMALRQGCFTCDALSRHGCWRTYPSNRVYTGQRTVDYRR